MNCLWVSTESPSDAIFERILEPSVILGLPFGGGTRGDECNLSPYIERFSFRLGRPARRRPLSRHTLCGDLDQRTEASVRLSSAQTRPHRLLMRSRHATARSLDYGDGFLVRIRQRTLDKLTPFVARFLILRRRS